MRRIIASVLLAIALLTTGIVAMQPGRIDVAYADGDGGSE
jgi:hypothetical protein